MKRSVATQVALFLAIPWFVDTLAAQAKPEAEPKYTIRPEVQKIIDEWKTRILKQAEDPAIVSAVVEQNRKGPLAGMTNEEWKKLKKRDEVVKAFQTCTAGKLLAKLLLDSQGVASEAFLNGAAGEKVAFVEKTSSYLHKGKDKFEVPFTKNETWQGQPELDDSSQTFSIQLAVPVREPRPPVKEGTAEDAPKESAKVAEGTLKAIGVLVVGLNLSAIEESLKAAKPSK